MDTKLFGVLESELEARFANPKYPLRKFDSFASLFAEHETSFAYFSALAADAPVEFADMLDRLLRCALADHQTPDVSAFLEVLKDRLKLQTRYNDQIQYLDCHAACNEWHMMNMNLWPSLFSVYMQDGGRMPGKWLEENEPDPNWSPSPPLVCGMYWVFDIETRFATVLHLYNIDEDEGVTQPDRINCFAVAGLNPTCDSMGGKVLYGPLVSYDGF